MADEQIILEFVGKSNGLKEFLDGLEQGIQEEVQAIQKANKEFLAQDKVIKTLDADVDKLTKSFLDLSKGIAGGAMKQGTENIAKVSTNVTKATGETQKLTTQLRALREQLSKLDEGSAEFERLSIEAGKLQDRIGDISQRVRALSSDTFAIDALVDTARAAAGAFSIAQGAAALFGDENEDLQKALLKVQASLAILNGLQETSAFLTGQSAGKIAIVNAAQKAYTFVTNGATLATRAFNLALVGLGAGAIITGIVLLVNKLREGKDELKGQGEEIDKNIEKFKELKKVADDYVRSLTPAITDVNLLLGQLRVGADAIISPESAKTLEQLAELSESYFGTLKAGVSTYAEAADAARRFKQAVAIESDIAAARKELEDLTAEFTNLQKEADAGTLVSFERISRLRFTLIPEAQKVVEELNKRLENIGGSTAVGVKKAKEELEIFKRDAGAAITELNKIAPDQLPELEVRIKPVLDEETIQAVNDFEQRIREEQIQREKEKQDTIREAAIQSAQQTFDTIFAIDSERRQRELGLELDALNRRREAELANKDLTEAQRLAIDNKYRQQERQLRLKAFNAEKQAKISQAIINGALAITNVLANMQDPTITQSFKLAAIALNSIAVAAQVATISAQKPPAFAKGTKNAPGGMALVGEEGAELVHLPRGAKVIPHAETMKVLNGHPDTNDILSRFNIPIASPKIGALKESFAGFDYERFEKILQKNRPQSQVIFDKQGIITIVNDEGSRRTYLGQRYSAR